MINVDVVEEYCKKFGYDFIKINSKPHISKARVVNDNAANAEPTVHDFQGMSYLQ